MKKIFTFYFLLVIGLINNQFADVIGQNSFDSKKKCLVPVNSPSLNTKKVNTPGVYQTRKSSNTILQNRSISNSLTNRPFLKDKKYKVFLSSESNLPVFISSEVSEKSVLKSTSFNPATRTYDYLNALSPILKTGMAEDNFAVNKISVDKLDKTHVRLDQVHNGVKIYGSEVMVHLNQAGEGEIFNGRYVQLKEKVNTTPVLNETEALNIVEKHLRAQNKKLIDQAKDTYLNHLEKPVSELVIFKPQQVKTGYSLVYHLTVFTGDHHRWEYFIDARNGNVRHYFENICEVDGPKSATADDLNGISRAVNSYQVGTVYYLMDASREMFNAEASQFPDDPKGAIVTLDINNTWGDNFAFSYIGSLNNTWDYPKAVSAHYNAGVAYEYYRTRHNRNSIDGNGGTIISLINVVNDETGEQIDNAYWNGYVMSYGNGNVSFKPLAGSLDVAGHEMTHGVVEHTAGLIYEGESGALNESYADIFASLMDDEDWLIGEDVVLTSVFHSGALRSLENPHNGGSSFDDKGYQPNHMNEKYIGDLDKGGVHRNSGIPNHAFYLIATAIGRQNAADVYYKALTDYLTKSSQFIDMRLAVIQAATDLFGAASNEVNQAKSAFDAVGITDGQGNEPDPDLPENPGEEYVLVYNTDIFDDNTLYRSNLEATEAEPLTTTVFLSRPSVTDDGSVAVFVADDKTIHAVYTSPDSDPDEFVIQEDTIWSNAVISKDGNRLAAVTDYIDTAIYVYDFNSEFWTEYILYSPTYTEDVKSAGPIYADALEFDYSGEYLVYDAYNVLENNDGDNIEYWDVNFIRVWDNEQDDFGDGEILKLFSSLPDDVSIGNPTFSKNSPNIIAFDYYDSGLEEYSILGCNIETNDLEEIVTNNTIGWPSYNKDDSRLAYSSINNEDAPQIDYVLLNADKITSAGEPVPMFSEAMWPVYFSTGDRVISSVKDVKHEQVHVSVYPNPFEDRISVEIPEELAGTGRIELLDYTGRIVCSETYEAKKNQYINVATDQLTPGYYIIKLENNKVVSTGRILKAK